MVHDQIEEAAPKKQVGMSTKIMIIVGLALILVFIVRGQLVKKKRAAPAPPPARQATQVEPRRAVRAGSPESVPVSIGMAEAGGGRDIDLSLLAKNRHQAREALALDPFAFTDEIKKQYVSWHGTGPKVSKKTAPERNAAAQAPLAKIEVGGLIIDEGYRAVVLNGEIVEEGAEFLGYQVEKIERTQVTLKKGWRTRVLPVSSPDP